LWVRAVGTLALCVMVGEGGAEEEHRIPGPGSLSPPPHHTPIDPPPPVPRPTPAGHHPRTTTTTEGDNRRGSSRLMKSFVFGAANALRKFAPYLRAGDPKGISIPPASDNDRVLYSWAQSAEYIYIYMYRNKRNISGGERNRIYERPVYNEYNIYIYVCVWVPTQGGFEIY